MMQLSAAAASSQECPVFHTSARGCGLARVIPSIPAAERLFVFPNTTIGEDVRAWASGEVADAEGARRARRRRAIENFVWAAKSVRLAQIAETGESLRRFWSGGG
jgi:hypothetical protein